jgi:glycosyltransferase involved in cell wall biosynthesis
VKQSKNILFISYDGMTDPLGQSQVIPYLQGLSKDGNIIFLLSCEKPAAFAQHKPVVENLLKGFDITWVPIQYTKNPPVLSTLLDIRQLRKQAKMIHKKYAIDMVHTRAGVPALVGLWMKKKFGVKFLHDIREFYADSRVEGDMWNLKNPLYKIVYNFFKKKEAQQVIASDGIVCLTYAAEKIIKTWPEYNQNTPLQVIPCSADLVLFDADKINDHAKAAIRKELGINEGDFVVSYLGSIGGWYLTDEMLRFCKVLSDKITNIKFLFISPHRHEEIAAAGAKQQLDSSTIIVRKAARKQVPLFLSVSNMSIFFIRPCYSKQSSSPTKHGEIMAMGIPLVTNSGVGDVDTILEQYHSGFVIPALNEKEYINIAEKIASGIHFNTTEIRRGAKEFYSLEAAVEKYKTIYDKILR